MDEEKQINDEHTGLAQNKNKKRNKIIIAIISVLVIVVLVASGYIWYKMSKMNRTELEPDEIEKNELSEEQEEVMEEYTNIAVFGVDNRSNGNYGSGNSDTIMIASINNQTKEVKIVSVYRDTYLRVNNEDIYGKANSAYAYNGAAGGISMLNTNLDLDITQYVTVDWYALVDAINLLGGVEIEITEQERQKINEYIPEVERVTGIDTTNVTSSGTVTLDGVQATAYVRIRKLAGNDYKRTQRQRIVIEAMLNKVKKVELSTLNTMIDEIFPMIETNLKLGDILNIAMNATRYKIISTTGFPFDKSETSLPYKGDCVVPITLESNVIKLHEYLFDEGDQIVSDKMIEISNQIISDTGLDSNSPVDTDSYTTGDEEMASLT